MAKGLARLCSGLLAATALVGCTNEEPDRAEPSPVQSPPVAGRPSGGTAKVYGRVTFDGPPADLEFVRMSADPYCVEANQGHERQAYVRVGPAGGLADVFVYVSKGIDAQYAAPKAAVILDQQRCAYVPKVLGLQVGQPLEIRNSDQTLHNVHALPEKSDGFNIGMPQKGMSAVRKLSVPEILVRIKCDVHPWMAAYVGVVAHPFHAVTAEDGTYELSGLPAGEYTIAAVHYDLGGHVEKVTLAEGAAATVDFTFSD
jgi:plastocyanin